MQLIHFFKNPHASVLLGTYVAPRDSSSQGALVADALQVWKLSPLTSQAQLTSP